MIQREEEDLLARGPGWEERRNHRAEDQARWQLRAAQLSALELAQEIFGPEATTSVLPWGARPPMGGGLTLRVPFRGIDDHRTREALFLALARLDPVLSSAPFLFVFQPEPLRMASSL